MTRKPLSTVAADVTLTLRMTAHDRTLLDGLVAHRAQELSEMGATEIDVTVASYLRGLIRREATAKGITAPLQEAPEKPVTKPTDSAPPSPANKQAAKVHASFLSAIDKGAVQATIARSAGIDPGALSRFRKTGKGIAPEKLTNLEKALK